MESVKRRKDRCNAMLKEILDLVDRMGILRRPTWDGVRVLLLIMPLTEGLSSPPLFSDSAQINLDF